MTIVDNHFRDFELLIDILGDECSTDFWNIPIIRRRKEVTLFLHFHPHYW